MPTRRQILGAMAILPFAGMTFPAWAQADGDRRLVVVILRGAMDGLSAVPAYGDPAFSGIRKALDPGKPGMQGGALDLDGMFGLHPSLSDLHALYRKHELLVVHAAATPYRARSHFSGQDALENGTASATGARDGWLARTLPLVQPGEAIAISETVPYMLRGAAHATAWTPSRRRGAVDPDTMDRLQMLYAEDPGLSASLEEALQADAIAGEQTPVRDGRKASRFIVQMEAAARFLAQPSGPRIAVVNSTGWDTHLNQNSRLGRLFTELDTGIAALRSGLGETWNRTALLVVTEFGRTVALNGTAGTDHGTGGVALVAGGAVNGGRVIADWPGLSKAALLDGRDLRPTIDLRAVVKGILHDHLRVASSALDGTVFPESGTVTAVRDLIRA